MYLLLQGTEIIQVAIPPGKIFTAAESSIEGETNAVIRKPVPAEHILQNVGPAGVTAPGLRASDSMVRRQCHPLSYPVWMCCKCHDGDIRPRHLHPGVSRQSIQMFWLEKATID